MPNDNVQFDHLPRVESNFLLTEIKARLKEPEWVQKRLHLMATAAPEVMTQVDTFFPCANGRLKLRYTSPTEGKLIFYARDNATGPKASECSIAATSSPDQLRETLRIAYGTLGDVRKVRTNFTIGEANVHFDLVEGLGHFLEIEVNTDETCTATVASALIDKLLTQLQIGESDLIACAYIDLLSSPPLGDVQGEGHSANEVIRPELGGTGPPS